MIMAMKFKKNDLVLTVQKNRDAHRAIFLEALDGYKKKAIDQLEAHIERVKRGDVYQLYVSLAEPMDHTRDYNRLLKMLDMTVDEDIEITEAQFAQYILDDWEWKRQFISTNSAYSATALRISQGDDE